MRPGPLPLAAAVLLLAAPLAAAPIPPVRTPDAADRILFEDEPVARDAALGTPLDAGFAVLLTSAREMPWSPASRGPAGLPVDFTVAGLAFRTSRAPARGVVATPAPAPRPLSRIVRRPAVATGPDAPRPADVQLAIFGAAWLRVPEPGSGLLALAGLAALAWLGRPRVPAGGGAGGS